MFALEVPPAGYEWVRDGNDALLVNTDSGEILQLEYGVFS
jgi:Ni/Co efflux regulator RcnB